MKSVEKNIFYENCRKKLAGYKIISYICIVIKNQSLCRKYLEYSE